MDAEFERDDIFGGRAALRWHRAVFSTDCSLDPSEAVVMLALVKHANEHGRAWPSFGTLCAETRIGRTKLIASIAELEARGLFVRTTQARGKGFGSNSYLLPIEPPTDGLKGAPRLVRPANQSAPRTSPSDALDSPPSEPSVVRPADGGSPSGEPYLLRDLPKLTAQVTRAEVAGAKKERKQKLEAHAVFEAWKLETSHPRAELDQKRETRIVSRLRDGFTVEQLIIAMKNRRNDPWLMGETSDRVYDAVDTLLRDRAQVERLLDLTAPIRSKSRGFERAGDFVAPPPSPAEDAARRASAAASLARAEAQRDADLYGAPKLATARSGATAGRP